MQGVLELKEVKDGVEITRKVIIPYAEYRILMTLGKEALIAPEVSRRSGDKKISPPSASSLLHRLVDRGLVKKTEEKTFVYGTLVRRVVFQCSVEIKESELVPKA